MDTPGKAPKGRAAEPGQEVALAPKKVTAFFDLDKTIIATSSALAYGKEFLNSGLITPVEALQMSMTKTSYMFSGHTSEQMDATRDQLARMVAGWEVEQVRDIARQTLEEVISPTIYEEARELIEMHRSQGHEVVIISASARDLVLPIAQELGVEQVVATELGKEDGKFTGEITFYCKGSAKAETILRISALGGYDLARCYAYSDSITDLPMLEAVGNPVVVNPDRALKKIATERGWEQRSFKNPVPLFKVPTSKEIGISTGVAAALAVLTAGGYYVARHYFPPQQKSD